MFHATRVLAVIVVMLGVLALSAGRARGDARAFTFVYETTTMPEGEMEYEQWVTYAEDSDSDVKVFEFRHEFEFGVTDDLALAFYVADWQYVTGEGVEDQAQVTGSAVEAIYSLTSPTVDPIGIALYGEGKFDSELIELEGKLLLQKNIGRWIIAYNGIIEAEWEGERYHEDSGELGQTLGVSYQLNPGLRVGAELINEIEYEDFEEFGDPTLYLGPNVHYATGDWWITVTPVAQLTDVAEAADFQVRMIFGVEF